MEEMQAKLSASLPVFIDTETIGLYGRIRLLQVYQEGLDAVQIVEWPNPFNLMLLMQQFQCKLYNAHYDITTAQQVGNLKHIIPDFDCLFLAARLAYPEQESYTLDNMLFITLGFDPYEKQGINKKAMQSSNWAMQNLTEQQYTYAATDVYYMPILWQKVSEQIDTPSYTLDKYTLKYCLEFQWHGMPTDRKRMKARLQANNQAIAEIGLAINVNSYVQVRKYLGVDGSDDLTLAKLALAGDKKAETVRKVRKLKKQNSFLEKFLSSTGDVILGKFKPSARSGRLTSDDQNLQQLPRALKEMFGFAEDEGRVLLFADYAQLELRTICAIVACVLMADLFRKGVDLHKYTADFLFGETDDPVIAKYRRQVAKGCNFLLLYGGGGPMFVSVLIKTMSILLEEHEALTLRQKWRRLWKEIYAWQNAGVAAWKKGKLGSTPLGRRYKAQMLTDQLNIENQGAGAEVAKLALHYFMRDKFRHYPEEWDIKVCNFIHDSYILAAPNDPAIYKVVAKDLAESMQLAWFEMSKCFRIKDLPMPVKVSVGYNWGDIENEKIQNLYDFNLDPMAMYGVHP